MAYGLPVVVAYTFIVPSESIWNSETASFYEGPLRVGFHSDGVWAILLHATFAGLLSWLCPLLIVIAVARRHLTSELSITATSFVIAMVSFLGVTKYYGEGGLRDNVLIGLAVVGSTLAGYYLSKHPLTPMEA